MKSSLFLLSLIFPAMLLVADPVSYSYDDAGRLVGAAYPNGTTVAYTYDPAGNLLGRNVTGAVAPQIAASGVVNGASYAAGSLAPGEIATVFGSNLTSAAGINLAASLPLPSQLQGVSVLINGSPAPLFAVDNVNGQQQVNFQVPWAVAGTATASVQVVNNGSASAAIIVPVANAQPGIINYSSGGIVFGVILHADYTLADVNNPVQAGETVLIYCTGLGAVTPQPVDGLGVNGASSTLAMPTVTIGGQPAGVAYSGLAPTFVGLDQVNAVIPTGLATGNQTVVLAIGGAAGNSVQLPVK